ncbi:hypothetical protein F5Y03DRAFT_21630 [Xylaria venustula]|nr:hypothetical protein F5Y03DRAFT_21630 [Xylaria venustula]
MRIRNLILSAGVASMQSPPGTRGQRMRFNDPATNPASFEIDSENIRDQLPSSDMLVGEERDASNREQVAISQPDINPSDPSPEQTLSISALLFSSSPGPKTCRGNMLLHINLSSPGIRHSTPTCYNVPGVAQCGNFVASKEDGCEARVFAQADCRAAAFANVAVFVPEMRPFGGYIRSVEIICGVVGVTPPPLELPGLELPSNALPAVG